MHFVSLFPKLCQSSPGVTTLFFVHSWTMLSFRRGIVSSLWSSEQGRNSYERERPTRSPSCVSLGTRPEESGPVGDDERELSTSPCTRSFRRKGDGLGDLAHPGSSSADSR